MGPQLHWYFKNSRQSPLALTIWQVDKLGEGSEVTDSESREMVSAEPGGPGLASVATC